MADVCNWHLYIQSKDYFGRHHVVLHGYDRLENKISFNWDYLVFRTKFEITQFELRIISNKARIPNLTFKAEQKFKTVRVFGF